MIFFLKKISEIKVPVEKLFSWHKRKGAVSRLIPPWVPLKLVYHTGGIEKGVKSEFKLNLFKFPVGWRTEHIEYREDVVFKDRQTEGPFSEWEHTHMFSPCGRERSIMEDRIRFKMPFGFLGRLFEPYMQKELERIFVYRHRVLRHDLESRIISPKKILVSGASGTIGSALVPFLQTCGHEVVKLVRKNSGLSGDEIFWDPSKGILDLRGTEPFDAVIGLNGADISRGRWTERRKKLIVESRVSSIELLADRIASLERKPEIFISSSAIGFYGEGKDSLLTEDSPLGKSFISRVCLEWEKASSRAQKAGIRTVQMRTGVVLTPAGGVLARMGLPFKMGLGARISHGKQFVSWISIDDVLSGILHIIDNDRITGPVNLTGPAPVTNADFSEALAEVFSKKAFFVIPEFIAIFLWGQMAKETLLTSTRVMPEKLTESGFSFQHNTVSKAFRDIWGR